MFLEEVMSGPVSGPKGGGGEEAAGVNKAGGTGPVNPAGGQDSDSQAAALAAALGAAADAAAEVTPDEVDQQSVDSKEQNPDDHSAPISRDSDTSGGGAGGGGQEEPPAPLQDEKTTFDFSAKGSGYSTADVGGGGPPAGDVLVGPGGVEITQGSGDDSEYSWYGQIGQSGASYFSEFLSQMLQAYTQATNQTLEQAVSSGNLALSAAQSQASATRDAGKKEAQSLQLQATSAFLQAGTTAGLAAGGEYAGSKAASNQKAAANQAQVENRQMDHTELAIRNSNKSPAPDSIAGVNAQGNRTNPADLNQAPENSPPPDAGKTYVTGDSYDPYTQNAPAPRSQADINSDPQIQATTEDGTVHNVSPYGDGVQYQDADGNLINGPEQQQRDIAKLQNGEPLADTMPTHINGQPIQENNLPGDIRTLKTDQAGDGMTPEQRQYVAGREASANDRQTLMDGGVLDGTSTAGTGPDGTTRVPVDSDGKPLEGAALSKAQESAAMSYMTPQEKAQYQGKTDPYLAKAVNENPDLSFTEQQAIAKQNAQGDIDTMLKHGCLPSGGKGGKETEAPIGGTVTPVKEEGGLFGYGKKTTQVDEADTLSRRSEAAVKYMEPHQKAELQTTITNKKAENEGVIISGNNEAAHRQRWTALSQAFSQSASQVIDGAVKMQLAPLEVEKADLQAAATQYGASLSIAQQLVQQFNSQTQQLFQAMAQAISAYNSSNGSGG